MVGGSFVWWCARPVDSGEVPVQSLRVIDESFEMQVNDAATRWAAEHGRPEAAPLIANKLRLGFALNERRRRKWSR